MFDVGIDLDDAKGIVLLHFEKDWRGYQSMFLLLWGFLR